MDHLINAARARLYWILCPEPDRTWTPRQLDDRTGETSDPYATSPAIGASNRTAAAWARDIPAAAIDGRHDPDAVDPDDGPWIEEAHRVVGELSRGGRSGRDLIVRVQADLDSAYRARRAGMSGSPTCQQHPHDGSGSVIRNRMSGRDGSQQGPSRVVRRGSTSPSFG